MASSCSISSLAPSFPMKIFPYVPRAPKPKPKSKAKSMATTKTAEHSSLGVGSSSKDDGEWFHIDDFPMPDSDASCSLAPANASGSLDHDVVGGLSAASESEKPEHYQSGRKSLDGGTNHATSVAKTNSALNRLFDGSSLEFPIILESDAAEKHYSTTQVKPSNGASDHQGNSHHAAADTGGYGAGQHDDLDAASMRALSEEGMEGIRHEPSLAEDEPLDIDVTSRSPLTGKRTRRSSGDTIISSAEVPEVTPELELEGHRSAKRRRPAEQGAECLILDPVSTSKSTSPPTPGGSVSCSRTSNDSSPCPLDSASKSDGARSPVLPLNDVLDVENSSGCAHDHGTGEEPLHFLRRSISPFEGIQGDQDIGPDSDRREEKSNASDDEVGESHEDKRNRDDGVSCGESVTASRQCEPSSQRFRKKRRGLSRTALGQRNRNTMPLRGGRQVRSSQSRQLSKPGTGSATLPCSPRTSPGTKAGEEANINHGPNANMAYQVTDLTLSPVPKGSSIVTAIVRYRDSKLPLDPVALDHKLLGGEGKVIRMTQLSPDSWMLLGYRYVGGALGPCTCGSLTLLNADRTSSPTSDAASYETDNLDDDGDEEDDNGEEDIGEYKPHATSGDQGSRRDDTRFRPRTHKAWLESDEQRLLKYKDCMKMDWKDIFERFPGRSGGAIKLRYYTLSKKSL